MVVDKKQIQDDLFEIVGKVFKMDPKELSTETNFQKDLNTKSVHGMKMCAYINYKYKVTLPIAKLVECDTLGDAVNMLDEFLKEN